MHYHPFLGVPQFGPAPPRKFQELHGTAPCLVLSPFRRSGTNFEPKVATAAGFSLEQLGAELPKMVMTNSLLLKIAIYRWLPIQNGDFT